MTGLAPIALEGLTRVAEGVARPEDVLVTPAGRVFASDASAAVSEIHPDGSRTPIGDAGGEPNGLALLGDDIVIANFALGVVQMLDVANGGISTLVDRIAGNPLGAVNYPLADEQGALWVSVSARGDAAASLVSGEADGYVFRRAPDGSTEIVVPEIAWPNCMVFSGADLYVVRTGLSDVARFERADGSLREAGAYGPPLGGRRAEEHGAAAVDALTDPAALARWGLADGCAMDAEGNLWVTLMAANRIVAITPELRVVTMLDDPEGAIVVAPTSIAWAGPDGRDLYIGSLAAGYVVKGRSPTAGC